MIDLTYEQKKSFYESGAYFNGYEFYFPDIDLTITNETIHQESVTIKESICDSNDLMFGGCIASSCEFEVSEIVSKDLSGLEFEATLLVNDGKDAKVKMGTYRVDSAKMVNDKDYKKITAYDALYDASVDVTDWYNQLFYIVAQYEEIVAVGEIEDLWEHGDYSIDNYGTKPPSVQYFLNGAVPEELRDTTYLYTVTGDLYKAENINKSDESEDSEESKIYKWNIVYKCSRKTTTKIIYAKTTLKKMRESLLDYLKIPYVEQTLANDDKIIERTINANDDSQIIGTDILKYVCELNAGFGKINRVGRFEVTEILNPGLYPSETLYPSEDLYPSENYFEPIGSDESGAYYISCNFEEYTTYPITGVVVKSNSDDIGEVIGSKENAYIISGNPLLYNKTSKELQEIGLNVYNRIKDYVYQPNTTVTCGLPYVETGDYLLITRETGDISSFILSRTLTGVQALKDTYESKGNKIRANDDVRSSSATYIQSKMTNIQQSVDGILVEVKNLDENTQSRFEQTADKIEAEVKRANNAEGELSSRITVTADAITAEVSRAKDAEINLSSRITQTSDAITAEVSRAKGQEDSLSSRITITANSISTKVSKGDVCSEINQSSDTITLNSNRLVVNSSNFTLDRSGNATFSGDLSGATGEFAGELSASTTYFNALFSNNRSIQIDGVSGKIYGNLTGDVTGSIYDTELLLKGLDRVRMSVMQNQYLGVAFDGNSSGKYHFRPGMNGNIDCGSESYKWDNIYADNGTISTSDKNEKMCIKDMSEEYACMLIDGAKPKTYKMVSGSSGRTHAGMIAQDLEQQLIVSGMSSNDFAGFIKFKKENEGNPTGEFGYGIRYEEYIAPLILYCQSLKRDLRQEMLRTEEMNMQILDLQSDIALLKQVGGN